MATICNVKNHLMYIDCCWTKELQYMDLFVFGAMDQLWLSVNLLFAHPVGQLSWLFFSLLNSLFQNCSPSVLFYFLRHHHWWIDHDTSCHIHTFDISTLSNSYIGYTHHIYATAICISKPTAIASSLSSTG